MFPQLQRVERKPTSRVKITHKPTCWLLGAELDGLGLGPEVLAGAVDPDVHALGDVVRLLQGQVPEKGTKSFMPSKEGNGPMDLWFKGQ